MKYVISGAMVLVIIGIIVIGTQRNKGTVANQQQVTAPTEQTQVQAEEGSSETIFSTTPSIQKTSLISTVTHAIVNAIVPERAPVSSTPTTLEETGSLLESPSKTWWLNSGGYFYSNDGIDETIQGDLPTTDKWYQAYKKSNPVDTDGGLHPQNIFRLVSKRLWQNYRQQVYFRITKQNLSASTERDAWSGLLLFNRYVNGDNLYYTGIRADGTAVIKSKKAGVYTTLSQVKVFPGTYDRVKDPNLLPMNTWIGLRSDIKNQSDGSVSIKLYMDNGMTGNWTLLTSYIDKSPTKILGLHYTGIRTDFMDVQFQGYTVKGI